MLPTFRHQSETRGLILRRSSLTCTVFITVSTISTEARRRSVHTYGTLLSGTRIPNGCACFRQIGRTPAPSMVSLRPKVCRRRDARNTSMVCKEILGRYARRAESSNGESGSSWERHETSRLYEDDTTVQ